MGTVIDLSETLLREQRSNEKVRAATAALAELRDHFERGLIGEGYYKVVVREYLKDITDFYDISEWKGKSNDN